MTNTDAGDMEEALLQAGFKPAGSRLTCEVFAVITPLLEATDPADIVLKLECLARCFAELARGDDCLDDFITSFPETFSTILIAAAYKCFTVADREQRTTEAIQNANVYFGSRKRMLTSMARSTSLTMRGSRSSPSPDPHVVGNPIKDEPGKVEQGKVEPGKTESVKVETMIVPIPELPLMVTTGMTDLNFDLMVTRITASVEASRAALKKEKRAKKVVRCSDCGKSKANCLCGFLDAPALQRRGEEAGRNQIVAAIPSRVPLVNPVHHVKKESSRKGSSRRASSSSSSSSDGSDGDPGSFRSSEGDQGSGIKIPSDLSFRNPAVLFSPPLWELAFRTQSLEDLRREAMQQFGVNQLRREQPRSWSTDQGECLIEVLADCANEGCSTEILSKIVEMLFRLRLFATGAAADDIDAAMGRLRGYKLPKTFRAAAAVCKPKRVLARPAGFASPSALATTKVPYLRIAPAVWKAMSPAAQAAHKAKYPK